jgi:hypothetical protein
VKIDQTQIDRLLAAGWIVLEGNDYRLTEKGKAALRRGFLGGVPGDKKLAIDSVRARAKPAIKKKQHRRVR